MLILSKGIVLDWTKGLSEAERESIESLLVNSTVLRRLKALIEEYEQQALDQETKTQDYDNPSWAYKQADRNGYRRGLKKIKDLLKHL